MPLKHGKHEMNGKIEEYYLHSFLNMRKFYMYMFNIPQNNNVRIKFRLCCQFRWTQVICSMNANIGFSITSVQPLDLMLVGDCRSKPSL